MSLILFVIIFKPTKLWKQMYLARQALISTFYCHFAVLVSHHKRKSWIKLCKVAQQEWMLGATIRYALKKKSRRQLGWKWGRAVPNRRLWCTLSFVTAEHTLILTKNQKVKIAQYNWYLGVRKLSRAEVWSTSSKGCWLFWTVIPYFFW